MNTGKYIVRSLRYILRMVILLGVVFAVLAATGMLRTHDGNLFHELFASRNGLLLLGVLIILAGVYPRLAFGEAGIKGNIHADRQKIKETMELYGFRLAREQEHLMVFHAAKLSRRIASQFDDAVTVTGAGEMVWIEGMKKDIYRIEGRLRNALEDRE